MNVNHKGSIGLIKVIDKLHSLGYHTFLPFDDFCPVDLIILNPKDGNTFRMQIKYRSLLKNTSRYELSASSVVNRKRININKELIDGWGIYLSNHDKVVFLSKDLVKEKSTFSISPNKEYTDLPKWFTGK